MTPVGLLLGLLAAPADAGTVKITSATASGSMAADENGNYEQDKDERMSVKHLVAAVTVGKGEKQGRAVVIGDGEIVLPCAKVAAIAPCETAPTATASASGLTSLLN